ncbi:unnamed protein product [Phyllotreta striolata]|uniref:Annexin n=1 Tax=Phyllotreta striolata TaxID=444603 RepID=A0A9N9TY33_PHYSR|nr:unnamed protein product [Phyllotreta striolata]
MSHPGYNPYQQGSAPGAPSYPQQPQGGAPSYPPINPNSFGYPSNIPMQMPQPMPMPAYPPTAPNYPPSNTAYPPSNTGYPPSNTGYPPSNTGYPPSNTGYLPCTTRYPPSNTGYQPSNAGYPPSNTRSGYPPNTYPGTAPGASPSGHGYHQGSQGPYGGFSYTHQSTVGQAPSRQKRTPTVVPANPFNPNDDAQVLRKAMKGMGTDEKAIINVLARRTNQQRLQIAVAFKTMFGKDLLKDLKSELTGNFEKLVLAMMTPLPEFYAKELHEAMSGIGTEEDVLIEVMCTMSNREIMVIREAYHKLYYRPLESDLKGDTSGTFKRLMVSLCNACRDESTTVDQQRAMHDAQELLRAGELRLGTDESTFNMVLCQRSIAHLQLVFQEYQRITGHDIEKAIKNEFSGDSEDALLAIVRSIKNQAAFFAKMLNKSMKGLGTNDKQLIRLVVTRCEIDMQEIKREYQAKYGESLADAIKGDCSGDYKKCLLALIGEY